MNSMAGEAYHTIRSLHIRYLRLRCLWLFEWFQAHDPALFIVLLMHLIRFSRQLFFALEPCRNPLLNGYNYRVSCDILNAFFGCTYSLHKKDITCALFWVVHMRYICSTPSRLSEPCPPSAGVVSSCATSSSSVPHVEDHPIGRPAVRVPVGKQQVSDLSAAVVEEVRVERQAL